MHRTIISAAGVVQDTGEIIPDRCQMTPRKADGCRVTGKSVCRIRSDADACRECRHAIERIVAGMGPRRVWSEADIAAMKVKAAEKWSKR
jgi:hypothetical protein